MKLYLIKLYYECKERIGIFGKILMKGGGGTIFLARERDEMVYNDIKLCLLTLLCTCRAKKHSKSLKQPT
jgi:hypothetical protein